MRTAFRTSIKAFVLAMLIFTITVTAGCNKDEDDTLRIIFWHAWGAANQELVDEMFETFKDEYPDLKVSLVQIGQGGFDDLRSTMTHAIAAGNLPTMVVGYPDHFVGYIQANALLPLNDFIDDPVSGVDLSDFVEGFIEENKQFGDNIYSLPLAKSTEMVVYNKTVFDYWKTELGDDFTHPEELDRAMTWDDLEAWRTVIVGSDSNQCEFLFNADSASNFFINSSRQFGAPYTNTDGEILVDNPITEAMLDYLKARFDDNTLVLPIEWDQRYGSNNFIAGDVCMTQGSTAGTTYNIPIPGGEGDHDEFDLAFEIGILPVVQFNDQCLLDPTLDPEDVPPTCAAMQQGPNVAIIANTTEAEQNAAWLFIRHMTNTYNTRMFAQRTGYIPIRYSAFNSPEYQAFLNTDDPDEMPFAKAAWAAYNQVNFYRFDPAFTGTPTSAETRVEVGSAIETLYSNSVSYVMDQLRDRLRLD